MADKLAGFLAARNARLDLGPDARVRLFVVAIYKVMTVSQIMTLRHYAGIRVYPALYQERLCKDR